MPISPEDKGGDYEKLMFSVQTDDVQNANDVTASLFAKSDTSNDISMLGHGEQMSDGIGYDEIDTESEHKNATAEDDNESIQDFLRRRYSHQANA